MRRAAPSWVAGAVLALSMIGVAADAEAASCCVSSSVGVPRLRAWEAAAVGVTGAFSTAPGQWDPDGQWRSFRDYGEREWRLSASGLLRVHRRLQLHGLLPVVLNQRDGTARSETGGGLGDLQVAARYDLSSVGEAGAWPGLALSLGVLAPTGRPLDESRSQLGADATGRGAWVISPGMTLEQVWGGRFLQATAAATIPLPHERADHVSQRFGPGVVVGLASGLEIVPGQVVLGALLRLSWESSLALDGRTIDNSGRADSAVGLSVAWDATEYLTVQAGVEVGLLLSHLGDNQPGRVGGSLGLRWAAF